MIGAAVDVGSNSVHLLVARVEVDGLHYLRDESEQFGLGDIVAAYGAIPEDAQLLLVHSLEAYRDLARADGAEAVTFLATDPLRRAANGSEVARRVEHETSVRLDILTRREEGELTFLGVSGGRPVDRPLLVCDIGGGSTEVIVFEPAAGLHVTGLATGSNRLSAEHVSHDPPTKREVASLRQAAQALVSDLPEAVVERAVFVGGTATNIVKLRPLSAGQFDQLFADIRSVRAARLAEKFGLRLRRALQLAAGAAIAEAILARYQLSAAETSEASLRDGAILAAAGRQMSAPARSG